MSSTTGRLFRVSTFGESHGASVGCVIDGCPPRLAVDEALIQTDLDRRRPGQSRLVTQRNETDTARIVSGVENGLTLGTPIAIIVDNADHRPGAYDEMAHVYRPSHADFTYDAKYGVRAVSGGGRASARETIGRVAAGAVARQLLSTWWDVEVIAWVQSVASIASELDDDAVDRSLVESTPTRCPDPHAASAITRAIEAARRDGDSIGGVVRCIARGVPAGWGDPVFDKLEATLAAAVMSLPACKGVEVGSGFAGTRLRGSEHNDAFVPGPDGVPITLTNNSGGIQGGISNGQTITLNAAFKPTATIATPQQTVTDENGPTELSGRGRHDPCVLPRAAPIVEAAVLLALADAALSQRAIDP